MGNYDKHAQAAMQAAFNYLSPEQCRNMWLLIANLTAAARDAEHASFLLMSEQFGNQNPQTLADFNAATRTHLNKVRENLAAIREVMKSE